MIDLARDYIKHLPSKPIPREDLLCLGYRDSYDYRLVFEEWEFRVYNYQWRSMDSIIDSHHENEDWRDDCFTYFKWGDGCLDKDTCEYATVKFGNNNPEDMAYEIWSACDDLEDRYSISDGNDEWPNDKLINFIKEHLLNKIYCYYK